MPPPPAERTTAAVDATGLTPGAISTCFVDRVCDRGQGLIWRHWLGWVIVADPSRQRMLAQMARPGPSNDETLLLALRQHARRLTPIACVWADAEFDSERNHRFMRQELDALSVSPATRGEATWPLHGIRAQMCADFPHHLYRQRAGVETLFSTTKPKLSARASDRSTATQQRQALLLGVPYNRYRRRFSTFLLLCL